MDAETLAPNVAVGPTDARSDTLGRTERLRTAVETAGRNKAVATRAGIHVGTLNNYLAGREMRADNLVALADACGVTVEWLATGRGPMRPGEASPPPPPPPQPPEPDQPPKLFSIVDMDLLGDCMEKAVDLLRIYSPEPSWGRAAQAATLLYDKEMARRKAAEVHKK